MKADAKKNKEVQASVPVGQRVQHEIIAWFWVALVFLLINGTIGQARVIPSGSMENTLLIGDHLIMSRIGYDAGVPFTNWHVPLWRNPRRQQVIIFKPPFAPDTPDYVKRVIGLPGDSVDIHDGAVWINGQRLIIPGISQYADRGHTMDFLLRAIDKRFSTPVLVSQCTTMTWDVFMTPATGTMSRVKLKLRLS